MTKRSSAEDSSSKWVDNTKKTFKTGLELDTHQDNSKDLISQTKTKDKVIKNIKKKNKKTNKKLKIKK